MSKPERVEVSPEWEQLEPLDLRGVLLLLGGVDTGKSTFARYLFQRLQAGGLGRAAFLDGDPGQASLGPPTGVGLAFDLDQSPFQGQGRWCFIGSTSPAAHRQAMLAGLGRLSHWALEAGATTVVCDTCGLISASGGGRALQQATIDHLGPSTVIAFQRQDELEPLLLGLADSRGCRVVRLHPSPAAHRRTPAARRAHRAARFAHHFSYARRLHLHWGTRAAWPLADAYPHRLLAFEDLPGFTLALGIVMEVDPPARRAVIFTPLPSLDPVTAIRLGDLRVDPLTFLDARDR